MSHLTDEKIESRRAAAEERIKALVAEREALCRQLLSCSAVREREIGREITRLQHEIDLIRYRASGGYFPHPGEPPKGFGE